MKNLALVADQRQKKCVLEERPVGELAPGEVIIKNQYSGINYKDALGVCFKAPIFRKSTIVPGIDLAGYICKSRSKFYKEGDRVLAQGMGLGEVLDGGYAHFTKTNEDIVVPLNSSLTFKQAMTLGTSGFTAALAVHRMKVNGQSFEKGPILVSGATGGVGQMAIQILHREGFMVEACTSRMENQELLENLGAHLVSCTQEIIDSNVRPLETAVWGGVVDNLGGDFLNSVLPRIHPWGNIVSIGLALGSNLNATVMPFILRGVSLLGGSASYCDFELRRELWSWLSDKWKPQYLDSMSTREISMDQISDAAGDLIQHTHVGKTVVKIQ